jgi:hypothetical protein
MDAKCAEYLMVVAQTMQQKAFLKWGRLLEKGWDHDAELARLECAQWAQAANELYKIVERKEVMTNGHQKE